MPIYTLSEKRQLISDYPPGCRVNFNIFYLRESMVKLLLQGLTGSRTSESEGKLDDSPHHRNISSNTKQCNVQIESLMFCKAIRHNATLFVSTLYHSKLR